MFSTSTVGRIDPVPRVAASTRSSEPRGGPGRRPQHDRHRGRGVRADQVRGQGGRRGVQGHGDAQRQREDRDGRDHQGAGRSAARPDASWAGSHRTSPVSVPRSATDSRMRNAAVAANSVPATVGGEPVGDDHDQEDAEDRAQARAHDARRAPPGELLELPLVTGVGGGGTRHRRPRFTGSRAMAPSLVGSGSRSSVSGWSTRLAGDDR